MRSLAPFAIVGALGALLHPAPAEACSPPPPIGSLTIQPADGSTGVPTNAQIRLDYQADSWTLIPLAQLTVRPTGGAPIDLAISEHPGWNRALVIARPVIGLAPNTGYEILVPYSIPCYDPSSTCVEAEHVVGTFTTGDAADVLPPVFGGLDGLSASWDECEYDACCGPYSGFGVGYGFTPATDDGPSAEIRYNLYRDGTLVVPMHLWGRGWFGCYSVSGAIGPFFEVPIVSGASYVMRAVDLSGNEDGNDRAQSITLACPDGPDAGASDAGPTDAGPGVDAPNDVIMEDGGIVAYDDSSGCSAASRRGRAAGALPLLVLAVALARRALSRRP